MNAILRLHNDIVFIAVGYFFTFSLKELRFAFTHHLPDESNYIFVSFPRNVKISSIVATLLVG